MLPAQYLQRTTLSAFMSGSASVGVASGTGSVVDMNNNGIDDLLVADGSLDQFFVNLDPSVTGIGTASQYLTTAVPGVASVLGGCSAKAGDVSGDGAPDVVVGVGDPARQLYVWLNDGSGTLVTSPVGPLPVTDVQAFHVTDLNADGLSDVVAATAPQSGPVTWIALLNQGAAGWVTSWQVTIPAAPGPSWTGDFNGDGATDLLWSYPSTWPNFPHTQAVHWIAFGTGAATFLPPTASDLGTTWCQFGAQSLPSTVAVKAIADVDGDGRDDLIATNVASCASGLRVLYGTATLGIFAPGHEMLTPGLTAANTHVLPGDWDLDGVIDLVVNRGVNMFGTWDVRFHLFRGNGARRFEKTPMTYVLPPNLPLGATSWLAPYGGDFDGDGDNDILTVHPAIAELIQNRAVLSPGCAGTGGSTPGIGIDPARIGNAGFGVALMFAPPGALAGLAASLAPATSTSGCALAVGLGPAQLLPSASLGLTTADASGDSRIPLPIPPDPSIAGLSVYAQWVVTDPGGGATLTGVGPVSLSPARTIIFR